jgi:hypothetical protein
MIILVPEERTGEAMSMAKVSRRMLNMTRHFLVMCLFRAGGPGLVFVKHDSLQGVGATNQLIGFSGSAVRADTGRRLQVPATRQPERLSYDLVS